MFKRSIPVILAICMVLAMTPITGFAATQIYGKDFNDGLFGTDISAGYSDIPTGGIPENAPQFNTVVDKKLVYDTTAVAGTAYPKLNATTVSYPRLNFSVPKITDAMQTASAYTYETDLRISKNFFNTRFLVRYGASNWVNGTTTDAILFEVKTNGILYMGTYATQLVKDAFYKISVVVDLTTATPTRSLYLNGQLLKSGEGISIGGGTTPKTAFSAAFILYPHTGVSSDATNNYLDTKMTIDNVKVIQGNPYTDAVLVQGDSIVYRNPQGKTFPFSALYNGISSPVTWSIGSGTAGVSVNSAGLVTVGSNSPEYFDITATLVSNPEISATRTIAVKNDILSMNFETTADGSVPAGWQNAQVQSLNGNKYLNATSSVTGRFIMDIVTSGRATLTWKGMVKSDATTGAFMTLAASDTGSWYIQSMYKTENSMATFYSNYDKDGLSKRVELGTYPLNTWLDGRIELNIDQKTYSMYYNDILVAKDFKMEAGKAWFKLSSIITNTATDDIAVYTDIPTTVYPVILGESKLYKPVVGTKSIISYTADTTNAAWALLGTYSGISISETGVLTVMGSAAAANILIKLTDTSTGKSSIKAVALVSPLVYNFENDTVGAKPASFEAARTPLVQQETNGNKYLAADGWTDHTRIYFGNTLPTSGVLTIESNVRVNSDKSGGYVNAVIPSAGEWFLNNSFKNVSGSGRWITDMDKDGTAGTFTHNLISPLNTWVNMKLVINLDIRSYDVYANNIPVVQGYKFRKTQAISDITGLAIGTYIDDIKIYSGSPMDGTIAISASNKNPLIPPLGKSTAIQLSAVSSKPGDITWGLSQAYDGISIDPLTGLLTITGQASAGTIEILATNTNIQYPTLYSLSLKRISLDFQNDIVGSKPSGWSDNAVIADENGNKYMSGSAAARARYDFPLETVGRVVFEADIRKNASGVVGASVFDEPDWITNLYLSRNATTRSMWDARLDMNLPVVSAPDGWQHLKIVFDTIQKTYSTFLNDNLVGINDLPMQHVQRDIVVKLKQLIFETDVDNITIYHAGNASPKAYLPYASNIGVGLSAKANYSYFDELGVNESCSEIKWFISDNELYNFTQVGTSSYVPTENDIGKYIKFQVVPAHDSMAGAVVESIPVMIKELGIGDGTLKINDTVSSKYGVYLKADTNNNLSYIVPIKNSSSSDKIVTLAAAYYKGGILDGIDYKVTTITQGTGADVSAAINPVVESGKSALVKLFLWDSTTLVPLSEALYIK